MGGRHRAGWIDGPLCLMTSSGGAPAGFVMVNKNGEDGGCQPDGALLRGRRWPDLAGGTADGDGEMGFNPSGFGIWE
ncbi:hypothetical protein ACLOJK_040607 [Asimina triloba]